jgi:methionyl-tRNA formyltransferase|tara:strand:- start:1444 stop:2232 length:789 start_codon:yes stop_codon:yes gene_type:complete
MKIVIFTRNAIRHKFLANILAKNVDDALIVCESSENDAVDKNVSDKPLSKFEEHFSLRYETEGNFFSGNDYFNAKTLPILYKEVNLPYVYNVVKDFKPDMMFVFGTSIIKEPLLSLLLPGHFINLHLGLSPYYRGAATNFWPFVNKELQYVGSTILHIDAGVDTGDIITHVRPHIEKGDNVHTVGCKVIKESVSALVEIMNMVKKGKKLNRIKQWKIPDERYYRIRDFNEDILLQYKKNLKDGLVEKYLKEPQKQFKLINLR